MIFLYVALRQIGVALYMTKCIQMTVDCLILLAQCYTATLKFSCLADYKVR